MCVCCVYCGCVVCVVCGVLLVCLVVCVWLCVVVCGCVCVVCGVSHTLKITVYIYIQMYMSVPLFLIIFS